MTKRGKEVITNTSFWSDIKNWLWCIAIFPLIGCAVFVGSYINQFDTMSKTVEKNEIEIKKLSDRLNELDKIVDRHSYRIGVINKSEFETNAKPTSSTTEIKIPTDFVRKGTQ